MRDDNIPGLIFDGVVDLGIIGENVLEEEELGRLAAGETIAYKKLRQLDFGGCRFSLAIDRDQTYNGVQTLANQRIATSYPHLLRRYMQQQGVPFKNCLLNGSVEVAPSAGLAAAICLNGRTCSSFCNSLPAKLLWWWMKPTSNFALKRHSQKS